MEESEIQEEVKCQICDKVLNLEEEFRGHIPSRRAFDITGMCMECQENILGV